MKKFLLLLTGLCLYFTSNACGNEYGYTMDGKPVTTMYFILSEHSRHHDTALITKRKAELRKLISANPDDYKAWSDYALQLMKSGKNDSALLILQKWIQIYPDEYNLNANLGTAYELAGKNDSALKYIQRDVEINPKSHGGSEWIHVKILQAKVASKGNASWFQNHTILDSSDFTKGKENPNRSFYTLQSSIGQLNYQIKTRLPFTPAPNRVMANLLRSMADEEVRNGTFENAFLCYLYAIEFEPSAILQTRDKRKIKTIIQRRSELDIPGLPDMFIEMMEFGKLDPGLILHDLSHFESGIDSLNQIALLKDSLNQVKAQLDSMDKKSANDEEHLSIPEAPRPWNNWISLIAGAAIGTVVTVYMNKRKAKAKKE